MRLRRGMSQDDVAYGVPMDRAALGMVENGKTAPTVLTLLKLAFALGCEVEELIPTVAEVSSHLRREASRD